MIYYAQFSASWLWKIGVASNVTARVAKIVSEWREPAIIFAAIPGTFAEEAAAHKRFAHIRAGVRGREWFRDDGSIVAHLATLAPEWRAALPLRPWARKGGRDRLPAMPAAWTAQLKREADEAWWVKHNHRPNLWREFPNCSECKRLHENRRRLYEAKSPLIFPSLYPRRPYATSQPTEAAS